MNIENARIDGWFSSGDCGKVREEDLPRTCIGKLEKNESRSGVLEMRNPETLP